MTFLILLFALAAERYLNFGTLLFRFNWFPWVTMRIYQWVAKSRNANDYLVIAAIILPFLFVIGIFYYLIGHWFWGFKFLIGLLIFLYCLGPQDLYYQINQYLEAKAKNDDAETVLIASQLLKTHTEPKQLDQAIFSAILYQANDRLFAVIFWFVLAGPLGAVFYRMIVLLDRLANNIGSPISSLTNSLQQLRGILEWVPARLTSFGYALVGSFTETIGYWLDHVFTWIDMNRTLLIECGRLALKVEASAEITGEQIRAALILVDRTIVAYLIAVGVIALVSFLYVL